MALRLVFKPSSSDPASDMVLEIAMEDATGCVEYYIAFFSSSYAEQSRVPEKALALVKAVDTNIL